MSEIPQSNPPQPSLNLQEIDSDGILPTPSPFTYQLEKQPKLLPMQTKILESNNNDDIRIDNEDDADQEYFKADPIVEPVKNQQSQQNQMQHPQTREEIAHVSYFKPKVYIKFFVMHLLFFCLLGPLIVILRPIVGIHVLRNQGFVGWNFGCVKQYVEYLLIISFILVMYLTKTDGLQSIEIYMVVVSVLIRMNVISTKYAYQSDWLLNLIHTKTFTKRKDVVNDLMAFRWYQQTNDVIDEEIQSAILNLEIDSPLFFFNFLCEIEPSLRNQLTKREILTKTSFLLAQEQSDDTILLPDKDQPSTKRNNRKISNQHAPSSDNRENILEPEKISFTPQRGTMIVENETWHGLGQNTQKIFQSFLEFFRLQPLESTHLYGYSLLSHLIKSAKDARYQHLGRIGFLLSVIRAMIPTLYRVYLVKVDGQDLPIFTDKPYLIVIIFLTNILFFWYNLIVFSVAVHDITTKVYCFKQIGYLLSPKKIYQFKDRKLYPTLNIFDPITLKTWSSVRKIMKEYGKKYSQRSNLNIAITMVFYIFILATFALQILGVFTAFGDPLILIIFGYESLIFFAIFISVMLGAAFLNNQYKLHKNLLQKNKTIITDFQRLSNLYVGKGAIRPDNKIYKQGLKILRTELGDDDFERKLIERSEKLAGMIDDFIEELEFEEENEPFRVMGVAVDYNLIKSLALGAGSLLYAIGQKFIN